MEVLVVTAVQFMFGPDSTLKTKQVAAYHP